MTQGRDVFGRSGENWGRSRMLMQPGGGSQYGEPIASPLERLRAFYKMQYDSSGGDIGGLASSEPPAYQVKMAQQAAENMKKNPVYQARRQKWDTQQAQAMVAEDKAMRSAAEAYDQFDMFQKMSVGQELRKKIEAMRTKMKMEALQQQAQLLKLGGMPPRTTHRW